MPTRVLVVAVAVLVVLLAVAIIVEIASSAVRSLPPPGGSVARQPLGNGQYRVFPQSGRATVGVSYQIQLFTHCGLDWPGVVDFDGTFWDPVGPGPASDGSANPPAGFGNPYDHGTITLISPTLARYRSTIGGMMQWSRHAGPLISAPCW
jgi:hypothetical protein